MENLKLFVCGNKSPNPDDWSIWDEIDIVIAKDKKQALKLCEGMHTIATEIPMDKPLYITGHGEPDWGDDI